MEETMFRKREISTSPSVNPNPYLESYMKISSVREDETFLNANRVKDFVNEKCAYVRTPRHGSKL
jgi:hypothetical protein